MITHIQSGVNSRNLPPWLAQIVSERQAQLLQAARAVGDATPASKEDVARHEAGHAVIAALLGCRVKRCFIKQEYGVWGGYTEPFEPPDWSIPLHDEGLRIYTPPGCIGRAFFLFAGPFAERMKGESGIANLGDCQEFRVGRGIVGKKETPYGPTERAADPGRYPGPVAGRCRCQDGL